MTVTWSPCVPTWGRCWVCDEPFTPEGWEARHSDPETGEDVHEACCSACSPPDEEALR